MVVQSRFFILFFTLFISFNSYAAIFDMSVDKTEFSRAEKIRINLRLLNADNISEPDISELYDSGFSLVKQHKFVRTSNINGKQENTITWNYILTTKLTGKLVIPKVTINTKQGKLHTKPIAILVSNKITNNVSNKNTILIENKIETLNPVLNQNIIYTVKITRYINIYSPQLTPPTAENAVIQEIFEPKSKEVILDGRNAIISQYYYLVTPIKAGAINISAPILRGQIINDDRSKYHDPFDFGAIRNFSSFRNYKEFVTSGNAMTLKVSKEKFTNYPWLPVKRLTVAVKDVNISTIKVGDAVTGEILLTGYNITGDQLPEIEFPEVENLKIYSETPIKTTSYDADKKKVIGSKTVKFTFIPSGEGDISFPSIKIAWWDVTKKKLSFATSKPFNFTVSRVAKVDKSDFPVKENLPIATNNHQILLSVVMNFILGVLLLVSLIVNYRQKNIINSRNILSDFSDKKKHLGSIGKYNNAAELQSFCIKYFYVKFNLEAHSLEELFEKIRIHLPCKSLVKLKSVFMQIDDSLYGKKILSKNIQKELQKILRKLPKKIIKKSKKTNLKLNPF